jgi:hypothetical protein
LSGQPPLPLEEARRRLKELGYLEGRVDRFLFRRAFEGRGGLLLPAVVLGASSAALASVAAIESAEPGFGASLAAVAAVAAHLLAAYLLPAALAAFLLVLWADRSRAPGGAAAAVGVATALAVFLLWVAGTYSLARTPAPRDLFWGIPIAAGAFLAASSARAGFLARAYAHSRVLPARRRGRVLLAAAALLGLASAGVLLASRRPASPVPAPRPVPRLGAVVVIAVDGLRPDADARTLDSARDDLLAQGAEGWWAARPAAPPEIWMDLATGEPPDRHGVRALERVRPLGSPLALRAPFGSAWYLKHLGPAVGLVSSAPVSAADRRRLAFWEVAASAGLPTLAVGWWASGPWPGAVVFGNEEILAGASDGLAADRRARDLFRSHARGGERIRTVYLPGLDILRADPERRRRALRETLSFLREEAEVARSRGDTLIVLAADSHAPFGAPQRMIVLGGPAGESVAMAPEDVAPSILARAGVPPAADLAGRPVSKLFAPGSLDTETVPSYGPRVAPGAPARRGSDREYLEKLKSLGYLN